MKRILIVMTILFSLAAMAARTQAQTPHPEAERQAALTKQLMEELKRLRLELLEQTIEFQQWKLKQIECELQQAQAEQKRYEEETRAIEHELTSLATSSDQQQENDALKVESGKRLQRLQARQEPVRERISDLTAQQNREETRLTQIVSRLKSETSAWR